MGVALEAVGVFITDMPEKNLFFFYHFVDDKAEHRCKYFEVKYHMSRDQSSSSTPTNH